MRLHALWKLLLLCATLGEQTAGQPTNDNIANAAWITSTVTLRNGNTATVPDGTFPGVTQNRGTDFELVSLAALGSNVGATMEVDEPRHGTHDETGASVWWKWTSPINGTIRLLTLGSSFDTAAGVYIRVPWDGISVSDEFGVRRVGAGDDALWNKELHTEVFFPALEGVTYLVAVGGFRGVTVSLPPKPLSSQHCQMPAQLGRYCQQDVCCHSCPFRT